MVSTQTMQISSVVVAVASCFLLFINMASASTAPTANLATTPRVMSKKYKWELDTQAMLANSNFKINPSELIKRCKEVSFIDLFRISIIDDKKKFFIA
jgi:hypothetical protein